MPTSLSPLAELVDHPQDVTNRRDVVPYGLVVHTTGSGVPTEAAEHGVDPLQIAHDIYCAKGANFPHYVIGYDGTCLQIADEVERARHVGPPSSSERAACLNGTWKSQVSPIGVSMWKARWPGRTSPIHLYPGVSPNEVYLGVELIPLLARQSDASLFTDAQYAKLAALIADIERRYGIALVGPRLVGHEDLAPWTRWNSRGGWDPGALNKRPSFFWPRLDVSAVPIG
jgi:hypothetical protein